MNNIKFIVYQNDTWSEEQEVLVTTPELEEEFLKLWFVSTGRDRDDYDRTEHSDMGIRVRNVGLRIM
jgi:hypothetical protein